MGAMEPRRTRVTPFANRSSSHATSLSPSVEDRGRTQEGKGRYPMTSLANPSSVRGILMPSEVAVRRLMMNSNFAARITGKSAGFSPLRIRPV